MLIITNSSDTDMFRIPSSSTILEALTAIELNKHRCVLLVDDDERVISSLTDGDIRKAILRNKMVSDKVFPLSNPNFKFIQSDDFQKNKSNLINKYNSDPLLLFIPVLDIQMKLVFILSFL